MGKDFSGGGTVMTTDIGSFVLLSLLDLLLTPLYLMATLFRFEIVVATTSDDVDDIGICGGGTMDDGT